MPHHSSPDRTSSSYTHRPRSTGHETGDSALTRKRKRDRWTHETYSCSYDSRQRRSSSSSSRRRRSRSSSSCRRPREQRRYREEERPSERDRRNGQTFSAKADRYRGNRAGQESEADHRANDKVANTSSMKKKAAWEFTDSDTEAEKPVKEQRRREVETGERGGNSKRSATQTSWTRGRRSPVGSKDERHGGSGRRTITRTVASMDETVKELDITSTKKNTTRCLNGLKYTETRLAGPSRAGRERKNSTCKAIKTDDVKKTKERHKTDALKGGLLRPSHATASNTLQRRHSEDTRGQGGLENPRRNVRRASMGTYQPSGKCPKTVLSLPCDAMMAKKAAAKACIGMDESADDQDPCDSGSPDKFRLVVEPPQPEVTNLTTSADCSAQPPLEETPSLDDGSFKTDLEKRGTECDMTAIRQRLQVRLMAALHTVNYTCQRIVCVEPTIPYNDVDNATPVSPIPIPSSESGAAPPFPVRKPERVSSAFFSLVSNWDERPVTSSKMPPMLKVRFGINGSLEYPTRFELLKARAEKAEGNFESAVAESSEISRAEKKEGDHAESSELPNRFEMLKARAEKVEGTFDLVDTIQYSTCDGFPETTHDPTPHACTGCPRRFKTITGLGHHARRCKDRTRVRDMETTFCICMVKPLEPIVARDEKASVFEAKGQYATLIEEWADLPDTSDEEEQGEEVGGFDPQVFCESCGFWFHIQCIGLELEQLPEEYHCPRCSRETATTRKRGTMRRGSAPLPRRKLMMTTNTVVPRRKSEPAVLVPDKKNDLDVTGDLETELCVPSSKFETEPLEKIGSKENVYGQSEDVCRLSDVEVSSDVLTSESETEEEEGNHSGEEEGVCEADEFSEKPVLVSIESADDDDDEEEEEEEEEDEDEEPEKGENPRRFSNASVLGNHVEDWGGCITPEEEQEDEEETNREADEETIGWMEIKSTDFVSSSSGASASSSSCSPASEQTVQGMNWDPVEWNADSMRQRGRVGMGKSSKHVSYFPEPSPIPGILKADPVMGCCIGVMGYAGGCVDLDRL